LYERLCKQVAATQQGGEENEEEWGEEEWQPAPELLSELLKDGVELIRSESSQAKWDAVCRLIDQGEGEKIVLFAQPIETVSVVAEVLEQRYGVKPALIIDNQPDHEHTRQVARFQSSEGPRFLVSSKAGSEGLNIQSARCLIHLDVSWIRWN